MRDKEKDAAEMAIRRQKILEVGFRLFSEKSIDMISMLDVAKICGYGRATLYRYFKTKLDMAVAIGTWAWDKYYQENVRTISESCAGNMTAAQFLGMYLDIFIDLYRNHADLLRFNQYFNIYVQGEGATREQLAPYLEMISAIADSFRTTFCKAKDDGTVRADIPVEKIFTCTLHIMLAAATRYAIGLVYAPENGTDAQSELIFLRETLLKEYVRNG